jgi:hypothetical protein
MFIALVLICQGGIAEINNCFVTLPPAFYHTEEACINAIAAAAQAGVFTTMPEDKSVEPFYPTDYSCFNWLNKEKT